MVTLNDKHRHDTFFHDQHQHQHQHQHQYPHQHQHQYQHQHNQNKHQHQHQNKHQGDLECGIAVLAVYRVLETLNIAINTSIVIIIIIIILMMIMIINLVKVIIIVIKDNISDRNKTKRYCCLDGECASSPTCKSGPSHPQLHTAHCKLMYNAILHTAHCTLYSV